MITMHHHLESMANDANQFFHFQSIKSFKKQMLSLKKRFVGFEDKSSFKITLDDGLRSQLTAVKILEGLDLKGYFYYNSKNLVSEEICNVHLVHILLRVLDCTNKKQLYFDLMKCSSTKIDYEGAKYIYRNQRDFSVDQRIKYMVNYELISKEVDEILIFYLKQKSEINSQNLNSDIYMSVNDLKELKKLGHEVLPHGHTHKLLGKMNAAELEIEFSEMCNVHETTFNSTFDEFCVPFGSVYSWSQNCEKVAKQFGISNIILVDDIRMILKDYVSKLNYFSRTDCCLLEDFEYV